MNHCSCNRSGTHITSSYVQPKCGCSNCNTNNVVIPNDDRFVPFALTIRVGETVTWTNNDTDPHTVVSDDMTNSIGPCNVNQIIQPGQKICIQFDEIGQWVYHCRFHSMLDAYGQPIAPGCGANGCEISGIQTPVVTCCSTSVTGNYGTPMMGVITILPKIILVKCRKCKSQPCSCRRCNDCGNKRVQCICHRCKSCHHKDRHCSCHR